MDLRPYIKNAAQLEKGLSLIRENHLFYQPFILADDIEVGEGWNLREKYAGVNNVFDLNVYAPNHDVGQRLKANNLEGFRGANQEYRSIYVHIADQIEKRLKNPIDNYSFAEIGCNTGLNLFNLAMRGAKSCHGYDWNDLQPVFGWLNELLGTNVEFSRGVYDNLYHHFKDGLEVAEVDVMINTVFTNHQCDPLQFLAYLCDRAREGVFLWALIHASHNDSCVIYTDQMSGDILDKERPFPLTFYNGVLISEKLLFTSLKHLGFDEVEALDVYYPSPKWHEFQEGFRMYYARRTRDVKSAYWSPTTAA